MWAERMNFDKGEWSFFSPCTVQGTATQQGTDDAIDATVGKTGKTGKAGKAVKAVKAEPGQQVGAFTSSVYSAPGKPCGQHLTTNSSIGTHGTSLTVGPSYQLSYSRCGKRREREETDGWLCVCVCVCV